MLSELGLKQRAEGSYRGLISKRLLASDPEDVLQASVIGGFHPSDFGYPEHGSKEDLQSLYDGLTVVACCIGERLEQERQRGTKRFLRENLAGILESGLTDAFGSPAKEGCGMRFLNHHKELLPDLVKSPYLAAMPGMEYLESCLQDSKKSVPTYKASRMTRDEAVYASQLFSEFREKGCISGVAQREDLEVNPSAFSGNGLGGFVLDAGMGWKALCGGKPSCGYGTVLLSPQGTPVGADFVKTGFQDVSRSVRELKDDALDRQFSESLRERHAMPPMVSEYAAKREGLSDAVCGPGKYLQRCRLYVEAAYPQLSKGLVYADIRCANDLPLPGGYPSPDPALVCDHFTGKDGRRKQTNLAPYSVEAFDRINREACSDGDKPVFYGDLIPRQGGFSVDVDSLSPSKVPFSMREHTSRTKLAKALNHQSKYLELEERSDLIQSFGLEKDAFGELDLQSDVNPDMQYGIDAGDAADLAESLEM